MPSRAKDFLDILKEIRGTNFTEEGLPKEGFWFDVKTWRGEVEDDKNEVAANQVTVAADKAVVAADKVIVAADKAIVAADKATVAADKALVAANAATVTVDKNTVSTLKDDVTNLKSDVITLKSETEAFKNTASAAAVTASADATTASNAAIIAATHAGTAATNAGIASAASTSAATSAVTATNTVSTVAGHAATASAGASTATTKATEAITARDFSYKWASEAEDVAVNDGTNSGYSAFHWAEKAAAVVGGITDFTDLTDTPGNYTGGSLKYLRVNLSETGIEFDTLSKSDVGLSSVDDTSDTDKPISTAQATALGLKVDKSSVNLASGSTITTTGAFGVTLNATNTTNLTLPETGTLATRANSETLTNKTINLSGNIFSGTKAEFNTACSDENFLYVGDIGVSVQAYDADTAKTDVAQNYTLPQRSAILTDNDGSFDLGAKQNFKCTLTAGVTLTFTNQSDGLSGSIILINGSNYAIAAHANTKISATALARISATGTYRVDYISDGTNAYCTASESLA